MINALLSGPRWTRVDYICTGVVNVFLGGLRGATGRLERNSEMVSWVDRVRQCVAYRMKFGNVQLGVGQIVEQRSGSVRSLSYA